MAAQLGSTFRTTRNTFGTNTGTRKSDENWGNSVARRGTLEARKGATGTHRTTFDARDNMTRILGTNGTTSWTKIDKVRETLWRRQEARTGQHWLGFLSTLGTRNGSKNKRKICKSGQHSGDTRKHCRDNEEHKRENTWRTGQHWLGFSALWDFVSDNSTWRKLTLCSLHFGEGCLHALDNG